MRDFQGRKSIKEEKEANNEDQVCFQTARELTPLEVAY